MHAAIRTYTGPNAAQFVDALERRRDEIERLIAAVDGFVSYTLVRTDEGGTSVTVCQTKSGADESNRLAANFVETSMNADARVTLTISEGIVIAHRDAS